MMGLEESTMIVPVPQALGLLLVMSAVSCTSSSTESDSADQNVDPHVDIDPSDSGGIGTGDDSSDPGPDPSQAPRVISGDIWCYEHSTGDTRYYWTLAARATDPQGDLTLQGLHEGLTAWQDDSLLATYTVVCADTGLCTSSFEESEDNILCSSAASTQFLLEVRDEDGNISAPYVMTGRIGADASGR
jgi:hypothetical protein